MGCVTLTHPGWKRACYTTAMDRTIPTKDVTERLTSNRTSLAWLIKLRWHAAVGQAVALAVGVLVLHVELPARPLAALVALLALSNLALSEWIRRDRSVRGAQIGLVLVADTLMLTFALALAGAAGAPFLVLYVVEAVVAALVAPRPWLIVVVVLGALGQALLRHVEGLAGAIVVVTAACVGLLTARVVGEFRARQALAARTEKLTALATLAGGAAHELATPLATIAVVAEELEELVETAPDAAWREVRVLRGEVERCRSILNRMSARAGEIAGESPARATVESIFAAVRAELAEPERLVTRGDGGMIVEAPVRGLVTVLASLVANGVQASKDATPVELSVLHDGPRVRFVVKDRGCGIPRAIRARVGEPFFTTKAPGRGMGLGVFLADAFARQCGGGLCIESTEDVGTTVALSLATTVGAAS